MTENSILARSITTTKSTIRSHPYLATCIAIVASGFALSKLVFGRILSTDISEVTNILIEAVRQGDVVATEKIIRRLRFVKYPILDKDGASPIIHAVESGHDDVLSVLLEHIHHYIMDLETSMEDTGLRALHLAASHSRQKAVDLLLKAGAEVNATMLDGSTPLHLACSYGHVEVATQLLYHGASIDVTRNIDGATPLALAANGNHCACVAVLLDGGADYNIALTQTGITPVHAAARKDLGAIVERILEAGAHPDERTGDGRTALMIAAKHNAISATKVLIAKGADVNLFSRENPRTALHIACQKKHVKIVELLAAAGSDVNAESADGLTSLCIAALSGSRATVRELLLAQADIMHVNKENGLSALCCACASGDKALVSDLIAYGSEIEPKDSTHVLPLLCAVQQAHVAIVATLLENGANPNTCSRFFGDKNAFQVLKEYKAEADNDNRLSVSNLCMAGVSLQHMLIAHRRSSSTLSRTSSVRSDAFDRILALLDAYSG